MKNNIVFLIILSFLLNGCFLSVPVENYINMTPRKVIGPYAPAGEDYWKENTTIEETKKEFDNCIDITDKKPDFNKKPEESSDEYRARNRNDFDDCMLAKGFIYMDKGINNNYRSLCGDLSYRRLVKTCKKNK